MIRLLLAEANPQVRDGLSNVLAGDPEILIGEALPDTQRVTEAVRRHAPDVVVLSASARGVEAVEACASLSKTDPRVRVVVALTSPRQTLMMSALEAGARAIVLKDAKPAILRSAVRTAASGWCFVEPRLTGKLVEIALRGHHRRGIGGLTSQELRVIERLVVGLSDAEIGRQLGVKESTVRGYVQNARRKLGAHTREEAGAIARRQGLV